MKLADFDYSLPDELIARHAPQKRDSSRLMVLDRRSRSIAHKSFPDLLSYLNKGDCLVLNDTRVIKARLLGQKETGGAIELLLVRFIGSASDASETWETLLTPSRRLRTGAILHFKDNVVGIIKGRLKDGLWEVVLKSPDGGSPVDKAGAVPLPPYFKRAPMDSDIERYQTVYAKTPGAVAAPTAGLHFTEELIERARTLGVSVVFVTLHVGPGTFAPVRVEDIEAHKMHAERYEITKEAFSQLIEAKQRGSRIFAAGTTATRALESAFADERQPKLSGETDIFIYPGYGFKAVDALITNFHLPKSTLLMLVAALAGKDFVLKAYDEAIKERYRFFSYGDAMLIL